MTCVDEPIFCFLLHKVLWWHFDRITIVVLLRSNCVLCRAATNWYFRGGGAKRCNLLLHLTSTQVCENFGGDLPDCLPLVADLVLYYLTRFFWFPAAPPHTVRLVRNSLRQEPTKSRSPDLSASKRCGTYHQAKGWSTSRLTLRVNSTPFLWLIAHASNQFAKHKCWLVDMHVN